ncbi:hypothetical protein IT412_00565 [Candidatus Peregrinibacteria bacterium]|nr:hypothetical protein [Candidatus Peregrinibacteria bacterium]
MTKGLQTNNFTNKPDKNNTPRKDFAKCITSKELIMYGDDNCEHCQSQKKMFGDDFAEINYVNCAFEIDRCREKQISVYPVWQKNDNKYVGVQSFEDLARISGCTNPN